ncbi:hypothetical protein B6U81_05115 [Thermoplasmatales archaeon ex4484_30]|nr:MAG: hypothetical protein B6U81_05115 [Thermoplasmatales archaeon ex4484_30]
MKNKKRLVVKIRGVVSTMLSVLFLVAAITGIKLFLSPRGKATTLHTIVGFLIMGLIVIHLTLNYKMLVSELRLLFRKGDDHHV